MLLCKSAENYARHPDAARGMLDASTCGSRTAGHVPANRLCPIPSADHLADSQLSYKAALRLLPANPGGSPVLPPVTRTHQHPCCNYCAHLLLSGQRAASVISLLTQGPAHIKRIIEICCSQIPAPFPASNSASGSTQFSNRRLHCPPMDQHRTRSLLNKSRGPLLPHPPP